eukprot:Seg2155.2 transcript_id=Seg2155.2/GoldUCD/mRNA.D3Y31 product="RNA/RNP complex-1-interacting phosphatase" protein_id=Seg2155.2/GoldUCD/D3Y31
MVWPASNLGLQILLKTTRRLSLGKMRIPDRWLEYSQLGDRIKGLPFICFKTPLSERFHICNSNVYGLREDEEFTPSQLCEQVRDKGHKLGMVIDLTNTFRYYDGLWEFEQNLGIKYLKLKFNPYDAESFTPVFQQFVDTVNNFMKDAHPETLIGVHCTHGLNRTGYLICRYMIEEKNFEPDAAIEAFNKARGHEMEKYMDALRDIWKERTSKTDGEVWTSEEGGTDKFAIAHVPESRDGYDAISNAANATRKIDSKTGDAIRVTVSLAKSSDDVPSNQSSDTGNLDNQRLSDSPKKGKEKSSDREIITADFQDGGNQLNRGPNQGSARTNQSRLGTYRQRTERRRVVHAERFYPPWEQNSQGYYDTSPYHRGDKARTYDRQEQYSGQGNDSRYNMGYPDTSPYHRGDKARTYDKQEQYSGQGNDSRYNMGYPDTSRYHREDNARTYDRQEQYPGQGNDPRYDTRYVDDFRYEGREPFNHDKMYKNRYRFEKTTSSSQKREKQRISQLEGPAAEKE